MNSRIVDAKNLDVHGASTVELSMNDSISIVSWGGKVGMSRACVHLDYHEGKELYLFLRRIYGE